MMNRSSFVLWAATSAVEKVLDMMADVSDRRMEMRANAEKEGHKRRVGSDG